MNTFDNINQTLNVVSNTAGLIRAFNLHNVRVPDVRKDGYNKSVLSGNPNLQRDASLGFLSSLGTPVFADVTLQGGEYVDNITKQPVTFPSIRFETVLLTVDFAAKLVKTEIQGRDGVVIEYIGQDAAKVTIQGTITGWNGHYPIDEVTKLNEWRKAPVAKGVISNFLHTLGIFNLVVEDCSLEQVAGGYSYQNFTINCISDLPVELKISNNV